MGGKVGNSSGPNSEINMTPLIDIVLVVLIIMMVNIPHEIERMGLKLPADKPLVPPPPPNPDQLVLGIYQDGTLALNRRLMKQDKLQFELQRRLKGMSTKQVFVDAHPKANYGLVVGMIDLVRSSGGCGGEIKMEEGETDPCPVQVGLAKMKDEGPLAPTDMDPGTMPRGIFPGMPRSVGALTATQANDAIVAIIPQIMGCYTQALAITPDLHGDMMLEVTVGPRGEQLEPPIVQHNAGQLRDDALEICINTVLPNLRFPALGTGNTARAIIPLLFSPG